MSRRRSYRISMPSTKPSLPIALAPAHDVGACVTYSGQLAAYVSALRAAGMECAGCWLHLPVAGGLVEVVLPHTLGHALTYPTAV